MTSITHIFGEIDIDLDLPAKQVYKKAFSIAENCGYMIDSDKEKIILYGSDGERAHLFVSDNKITKVLRAQFSDSGRILTDWHEVTKGSYISIYEVTK